MQKKNKLGENECGALCIQLIKIKYQSVLRANINVNNDTKTKICVRKWFGSPK